MHLGLRFYVNMQKGLFQCFANKRKKRKTNQRKTNAPEIVILKIN